MFFKNEFKKLYKKRIKKLKGKYNKSLQDRTHKFRSVLKHDIKTPILAQFRGLELLYSEKLGKLNKEQKEIIKDIMESNRFLYAITVNTIFLLDYENEKPKLKLENINVAKEIEATCKKMQKIAALRGQNIIFELPKGDINLVADKELFKKIILNLLTSSLSYGFDNTDILVSLKDSSDSISFSAKNKSLYMTKEKIKSLIDGKKNLSDFNQLGVNLNLNIATKLINAHNWDIVAQSNKDSSCEFGFIAKK